MKKKFLIACDLEGVNRVVGEPYCGLGKCPEQWETARRQAALEINAAAEALFGAGAECVDLWDNHGGGGNIEKSDLYPGVKLLDCDPEKPRMYFAGNYDAVLYFGYHAMEGTLGGVLAHTMNSSRNQYYKLNGKYIGEFDMDAYIAASHGVPSCFFVGGDITCAQVSRVIPEMVTVVTKREISRNEAEFRDNDELFLEIKEKVLQAASKDVPIRQLSYPAVMEKSYKRTEDAENYLKRMLDSGLESGYLECEIRGYDAHTVQSTVYGINEFIISI